VNNEGIFEQEKMRKYLCSGLAAIRLIVNVFILHQLLFNSCRVLVSKCLLFSFSLPWHVLLKTGEKSPRSKWLGLETRHSPTCLDPATIRLYRVYFYPPRLAAIFVLFPLFLSFHSFDSSSSSLSASPKVDST
jgi:hypothetical protein